MKRLSFRFVRRLMLLLALVFPVVYLMGGFVAALAGSHGNVTLAQDDEVVVRSEIRDFNQLCNTTSYQYTAGSNSTFVIGKPDIVKGHRYLFVVTQSASFSAVNRNTIVVQVPPYTQLTRFGSCSGTLDESPSSNVNLSAGTRYLFFTANQSFSYYWFYWINGGDVDNVFFNVNFYDLTRIYPSSYSDVTYESFKADYPADSYPYVESDLQTWEYYGTPTYSEYLFNQVLGSDNIIKQWGYYALAKDDDRGFAPFASLIQIVDDNFFHLGDSNDLGLFVYGYVYYALNIVAIYELVALVVMVFTIPLKLTDRFTKEM